MLCCLSILAQPSYARELRDAIGTFDNVATSEHFAVKWGEVEPQPAIVQATLDALELSWTVLVEERGYPAPRDSEHYYLNVYVGNSGGDAPTIDFSGGYSYEDPEGYAYIVAAPDVLDLFSGEDPNDVALGDPALWPAEMCAHEFFHTLQWDSDLYASSLRASQWVWESGANYAAHLVVPDGSIAVYQSIIYWTTPYTPLTDRGEDTPDAPYAGARSYGVWTWWQYLDEIAGAPELMRDLWLAESSEDAPLDDLIDLMAPRELDFPTLFFDFAIHNATYDYSFGAEAAAWLESEEHQIGGERIVATWDAAGTGDWQTPVSIYGLHRVSYNVVEVEAPGAQGWRVEVDTDDESVLASVVIPRDSGIERFDLADGVVEVDTTKTDHSMLLLVVATETGGTNEGAIPYSYRLSPMPAVATDDPVPGCGCAVPGAPAVGPASFVALALLALGRRARRTDRRVP